MKWFPAIIALYSVTLYAADISGTWKAKAEGPNGAMERTFVFQQAGTKLTGEAQSAALGKSTIENGKVEGDDVSFNILVKFGDNEMKVNYKGKINGKEIRFTAENQAFGKIEWLAKKAE